MKAFGILLLVLLLIGGGFFGCAFSKRNLLIAQDEGVTWAWSNVESTYQRRLDLIPNLVETVKGAARYEGETLTKITEKRNQVLALARELGDALKARDTQKMDSLESALMASVRAYTGLAAEAYPNLNATKGYADLMSQLEGTENRINVARDRFNEAVADYDTSRRSFPTVLFAGLLGFDDRAPFQADDDAQAAPDVDFGTDG